MKSYDSRSYSVNDFIEWEKAKALELNPGFQRRAVWSENAKSYLMDTVLRGKPIPKIFIRQKINVTTKTSIREVVDGQQRLRTILSFVKDGFSVKKLHNGDFGGKVFSELPESVQEQVLAYELSVDLLINLPDAEILDIFSRLNTYSVTLNEQEKNNAKYFGPFKVIADKIGHKYYEYWSAQGLLATRSIVRMDEINLVADLLIAMITGIKSKKQIGRYYAEFEKSFDYDVNNLEKAFDNVISLLEQIYPEGLRDSAFHRIPLYYSLFTAIHQYSSKHAITERSVSSVRSALDRVEELIAAGGDEALPKLAAQFLKDIRLATTDEVVRRRRTDYILKAMRYE